ncbi:NADPH:quinone reductase [Amycolatopsis sacchari]|uniref:NADPH2:quinone reductase n=1 Tax=Amycolatopsis sacchari TaxID=115433 RepID=A0A1I3QZT2_9PSEU|nr:NADPH:quinone reductase [Amycolatopsis sacchari]SFJ39260.1 NADPH2:quinone reductase [Amycolatopsis sacchari]
MKAISYRETGDPEVLRLTERPVPEPGPGEVRVQVKVSGVNPTDWKNRRGSRPGESLPFPEVVPNQDGAGIVDAVGPDVTGLEAGQRVWLWEAAWQRADGTAQEYVVLPARQAVPLPDSASFDLGASLGIPALTAHRALTVGESGPDRLSPGALTGRSVLVAGGAGAVGHAAIELARWAGARVITTVSSPEKARLASAAGAHHVVNYRTENAAEAIRELVPDGVDLVVEVAPGPNAALNQAVLAPNGTIAVYANNGGEELTLTIRPHMVTNARYQFVLVYTVPSQAKDHAVADVSAAVADGALRVGEDAGLPLHRFPLASTADAHAAVEKAVVGKVLIDVA